MDKKKGAHLLSWLAVLAVFIFFSDLKAEGKRFSIKFMGGISSHSLGDVNAYLEGASQFKIDDLKSAGYVADSEFEKFHSGQDLAITALIPVSDRVFLTIGSGYILTKKEKNTLLLNSSFSTLTGTLNHRIKAIPLSVGIHYALPLSSKSQLYLFSGGEFYFSKFSEVGQERLELKIGSPGYA